MHPYGIIVSGRPQDPRHKYHAQVPVRTDAGKLASGVQVAGGRGATFEVATGGKDCTRSLLRISSL